MNLNIECELMIEIVEGRDPGSWTLLSLNMSYFMVLLIIYNTSVEWMNELFILDYVYQLILEGLNYIWIQYGFHKTEGKPHW